MVKKIAKQPLISVIITNYNYGKYVKQAAESVLNQTYSNIELIIMNDGSTDNSDTVIKKIVAKNPQIKYINQKNLGANLTRNKGIGLANGEFIFLLDADNWLNPDHIEKMYDTITKKDADVVYGDLQHFGDNDYLHEMPSEFSLTLLKVTNYIDTASLIRKDKIGSNKFDPDLNRRFLQDWDFFLGLALKGLKMVKDPGVRLNYRVHDKQNGGSFSSPERIDRWLEVYKFITDKYKKLRPEQYGYDINWFISQYAESIRLIKEIQLRDQQSIRHNEAIKQRDQLILQKDQLISQKDRQMAELISSKSYRIGRIITGPGRIVRGIIDK